MVIKFVGKDIASPLISEEARMALIARSPESKGILQIAQSEKDPFGAKIRI